MRTEIDFGVFEPRIDTAIALKYRLMSELQNDTELKIGVVEDSNEFLRFSG